MSALMELRALSLMTTKICSSFSRLIKFPNQDFLASLREGEGAEGSSRQGVLSAKPPGQGQLTAPTPAALTLQC